MEFTVSLPDDAADDVALAFPEGPEQWLTLVLQREVVSRTTRLTAERVASVLGVELPPNTRHPDIAARRARLRGPDDQDAG